MSSPVKRILCVDDNEDTCFMLTALLGREGYEVKTAATIDEALAVAAREHFDLSILDNAFPGESGVELCRRLRRVRPDTPVIFYSGVAFEADREEALSAGARAYVAKPAINGLTEAVRDILGGEAEDDGQLANSPPAEE